MKAKYVNPFTDFGFKKIFGEEANKLILIDFLNSLLPENVQIKDLTFKNTEQLSPINVDRRAVYDIYCENEKGEKFIVELQKVKQNFFKDRMLYYSTFPIKEQAEAGVWNFRLKSVYCIGILDFVFTDYDTENERHDVIHEIKLKNQHGEVFYDKLTFLYLEMPNFQKSESELNTRIDKWLYFIKHLEDFQSIPQIFKDEVVFTNAFAKAELAKMTYDEMMAYEMNLKIYRDWYAIEETLVVNAQNKGMTIGYKQGMEKGIEKGIEKVARSMKEKGISDDLIMETTGLTIENLEQILKTKQ